MTLDRIDEIDRLVREANPVPDPAALEPLDASDLLDEQGRIGMQMLDRSEIAETPPGTRAGVLISVAAVAVIVIGTVIVLGRGDDGDGADGKTAVATADPAAAVAVETATGFVDAYRRHDADLAASFLTADALGSTFDGLEGLRLETRWDEQTGFEVLPGRCEHHDTSSSGITVRCPYEFHGLRSEALGLGPFGDNYYDVTVVDGEIVAIVDHIAHRTNGFSPQVWEPFTRWVADIHPDDVTVMYTDSAQRWQRITEDSIPLWRQHTQEYVEFRRSLRRVGLVGLPPEGAIPSSPERGEVVLGWGGILGVGYNKGLTLYADGRLIWFEHGPGPESVDDFDTGLFERRLTAEGVELLLSKITSTGVFGPDDGPFMVGQAPVVDSGREAADCCASYVNGVLVEGLSSELFRNPEDWLPASAWEDPGIRAYVPSRYAVCYEPAVLDLLPVTARDVLTAKAAVPDPHTEGDNVCVDVTTDEARIVAGAIDAELEELGGAPGAVSEHLLSYRFEVPGLSWFDSIWFKPYTPDGESVFPVYG